MSKAIWENVLIKTEQGQTVKGIAPLIISASRATDIPAFYCDWFVERLRAGYVKWINPFNGKAQYVSFCNVRLFIFWSKNPLPFMPILDYLDHNGFNYYFHFTLNDYQEENYEPFVPDFKTRLETFRTLSTKIGRQRVLWRFDPLMITDTVSEKKLLNKIRRTGDMVAPLTSRLTVSFVSPYPKVVKRCQRGAVKIIEPDIDRRCRIISKISQMTSSWNIQFFTCAQETDYSQCGAKPARCVDEHLIYKLFSSDKELMNLILKEQQVEMFEYPPFRSDLRDKGQRKNCGCMKSKDIGSYNSCTHGCIYCYANS